MKPELKDIQRVIIKILNNMTEDWGFEEGIITLKSDLNQDLGFSSIDVMHLFASIDMHYKIRLAFDQLVMVNNEKFRTKLTVEELAQFVYDNFDSATAV